MKQTHLSLAIALACCMASGQTLAQTAVQGVNGQSEQATQRVDASSTSNTTTANDTRRVQNLSSVQVTAQSLSLGGGLMSVQTAPKAVSTITREAIEQAAPGSNFTQMIDTIPGVNAATDDPTGLANGHYSMRGYDSSDIGMTVNGAPITDTGSYSVYATEYGDSENMGDITVLQGIPDIDMPDSGASGGHIGWATINPSHQAGVDVTQTFGSRDYRRSFVRLNTGDTGPVRSWLSFSDNSADKWRGRGDMKVTKVDGKSLWTINDGNTVSASLQYSRIHNYGYETVSRQQVQQNGYFTDYNTRWIPTGGLTGNALKSAISNDTYYYGLRTNPFKSYMFSMDGEFTLSDNLHLAVIPYYWYGDGGGGGAGTVTESPSGQNRYGYTNQDINGDGKVVNNAQGVVYSYNAATTYRPGVIFTFNQDFGLDNSLEYGVWYERSRKTQVSSYGKVDGLTGDPLDFWANADFVQYPSGNPMLYYREYTNTEIRKGFATDNWTPNDQWTFTAGLSYLWANRSGFVYDYPGSTSGSLSKQQSTTTIDNSWHQFLPAAGVKFQLDEKNQFFLGSGKTFRVPSNTVALLNALAGQDMKAPETSWNTDLGYRYFGDTISASADIYNSNYNNKQESAYDEATNQTYYSALRRMHMRGFNGEASYKFAPNWTAYASYTYTQAKVVGPIDAGGNGIYPTDGKMMPDTPQNMGNLSLSYKGEHAWATLRARVAGSLYSDYLNTDGVGGFTTFSFNAGYDFGDLGWLKKTFVKLNISNLTDKRAFNYVSSAPPLAQAGAKQYPGLYGGTPYFGLLAPRTYVVTFGASIF